MPEPLRATPGKGFTAETEHVRSTKFATEYRFIMDNLSLANGKLNFTRTVAGGWSGKHADVIAEWPFASHLDLANFGTIHFDSASVNGKKLGSFPHVENEIADNQIMAVTSSLKAQSNFAVTEHRCI
jgi:hypothetical protein